MTNIDVMREPGSGDLDEFDSKRQDLTWLDSYLLRHGFESGDYSRTRDGQRPGR